MSRTLTRVVRPVRRIPIAGALLGLIATVAAPAAAQTTETCGGKPADVVLSADSQAYIPDDPEGDGVVVVDLGGNDTIHGTDEQDRICAGPGDDTVYGLEGNDRIFGEDGDDTLEGAGGKDRILGGQDADSIEGGPHDDTLSGGIDPDTVLGNGGADAIEEPVEDSFENVLIGGPGPETVIRGGSGPDHIAGEGSSDASLYGGEGDDEIFGGDGEDFLFGEDGLDRLFGNNGPDWLEGGYGSDPDLTGGSGNDVIEGGDGADSLSGQAHADILKGGPNPEGGLPDTLDGGGGPDTLKGGFGTDLSRGGPGNDVLDESGDTLPNVLEGQGGADRLTGGSDDDTLLGGEGNDPLLAGGDGADTVNGGAGDDTMQAGDGIDRCYGGRGADYCHGGPPGGGSSDPDICDRAVETKRSCRVAQASDTWSGTASGTWFDGELTQSWTATYSMPLEYEDEYFLRYGDDSFSSDRWEGTMDWGISGTDDQGCTFEGSATLNVNATLGFSLNDDDTYWAGHDIYPEFRYVDVVRSCPGPGGGTSIVPYPPFRYHEFSEDPLPAWNTTEPQPMPIPSTLTGGMEVIYPDARAAWAFTLTRGG